MKDQQIYSDISVEKLHDLFAKAHDRAKEVGAHLNLEVPAELDEGGMIVISQGPFKVSLSWHYNVVESSLAFVLNKKPSFLSQALIWAQVDKLFA